MPLADRVRAHECCNTFGFGGVIRCLDEPACYVVQKARRTGAPVRNIANLGLLLGALPGIAQIWRVATDICFPTFIFKINLSLIQWGCKQIIGVKLYTRTCWRADAQPVQPQLIAANDPVLRIQRQKLF